MNITVELKPSILNNINLVETVNIEKLKMLINSSLLKEDFNNKFVKYSNEKKQLEAYIKNISNKTKINVTYEYSKNIRFGRVFPNKSLGAVSLRRELRQTIFNDTNTDIDIVNAHPVMLLQICKENAINCKYLKKYVKNRDEYLKEVIETYKTNRDSAKQLFIMLLYFGSFESWANINKIENKEPTNFILKFKNELSIIGNVIVKNNPKILKAMQKIEKENLKGSVVSYFLQEYECQILETVYLYCVKNRYIENNNCSLCFDGLMILKDNFKPELLEELRNEVHNKNGFKLTFIEKTMNEGYTDEQLNNSQISPEINNGVYNDLDAAQTVYKNYPHWVCCDSSLFVFDDKTGLWTEKEEVMFNIISRYNDHLYLLTNNNNEIKKMSRGYGNSTTLQRQMLPQLKALCINNNWLKQTDFSSLGKLLFLNGYLDMTTGIFYDKFNPDIVFFYRIHRNYTTDIDTEYANDIKQRYFYNQLGEDVGNYLISSISRSLAGDRMKKIFFNLGETNAGKSTYVIATSNSFDEYVGTFNGENLCIKNSTADEAQLMRWAYLLRYKRIILSNEMKTESILSGNMMKKMSSGGDKLVGRTHGSEEKDFTPHYNVFCNANDLLEIKPYDPAIHDRLNILSYKKRYVENPSNEFELLKDENIFEEMKTDKFKDTYSFIILNAYLEFCKCNKKETIPESVKNCKSEWGVGEWAENISVNKFLEIYEITNNTEHYIRSSEIEEWVTKDSKINISPTKFIMELKKYCKIKKFDNVESKNKKLNGKCPKCWVGIRKISDDDDSDDEPVSALDRL